MSAATLLVYEGEMLEAMKRCDMFRAYLKNITNSEELKSIKVKNIMLSLNEAEIYYNKCKDKYENYLDEYEDYRYNLENQHLDIYSEEN